MNFENLKLVRVSTDDDFGYMLSIQEDYGQEDDPDLAIAGVWNPSSKGKAYAQLFAAAPELLEALQEILAVHANDNIRPKAFYIASNAIAKAQGEAE